MLFRSYLLLLILLSLTHTGLSQNVDTKHNSARIFIGVYGGQMTKVESGSLNKTAIGAVGDLHTDYGVTWRSLFFVSKEASSSLLYDRFPSNLNTAKIFQVGLELGPTLRLVTFGKRGDWNLGGGILADYAEAKWVSQFEYRASTDETIVINRQANFLRVRPLVESNINFNIKDNWKVGVSMAVALVPSGNSRGGRNGGSGPDGIFYRRADIQSSGDYARFGFSIFYRVAPNSQL